MLGFFFRRRASERFGVRITIGNLLGVWVGFHLQIFDRAQTRDSKVLPFVVEQLGVGDGTEEGWAAGFLCAVLRIGSDFECVFYFRVCVRVRMTENQSSSLRETCVPDCYGEGNTMSI